MSNTNSKIEETFKLQSRELKEESLSKDEEYCQIIPEENVEKDKDIVSDLVSNMGESKTPFKFKKTINFAQNSKYSVKQSRMTDKSWSTQHA